MIRERKLARAHASQNFAASHYKYQINFGFFGSKRLWAPFVNHIYLHYTFIVKMNDSFVRNRNTKWTIERGTSVTSFEGGGQEGGGQEGIGRSRCVWGPCLAGQSPPVLSSPDNV